MTTCITDNANAETTWCGQGKYDDAVEGVVWNKPPWGVELMVDCADCRRQYDATNLVDFDHQNQLVFTPAGLELFAHPSPGELRAEALLKAEAEEMRTAQRKVDAWYAAGCPEVWDGAD